VVGLHVRLDHRDDCGALRVRERDVVIDEIDVRLDHRERCVGLAPQQV
jgi:hypothetical protein